MTAKVLGIPKAAWATGCVPVSRGNLAARATAGTPEQMELARPEGGSWRGVKMERDIAKEAAAYFAQDVLQSTPGFGR